MTLAVNETKPLGTAIYEILREAQASESRECRDRIRYSFFRPLTLHVGTKSCGGFSREVSETGIGLLHNFPLRAGEIDVTIPTEQGYSVRIHTRIIWCTPCGEDWFISGGEFVNIAGIGE